MKYDNNFIKTDQGNGIYQGSTLTVSISGAEVIAGGIYQNNFPVLIDQGKDTLSFKLRKGWLRRALPKGRYVLKLWYYDYDTQKGGGIRDEFDIV